MINVIISLVKKFLNSLFDVDASARSTTIRSIKRYQEEENRKKTKLSGENTVNFLGLGSSLVGDIKTESDLRIDGTVTGNITTTKTLVIGYKGKIRGNIRAASIVCSGQIQGDFHSANTTSIEATGYYEGTLTTKTLQIDSGAFIGGKILTTKNTRKSLLIDTHKHIDFQSELELDYPIKTV